VGQAIALPFSMNLPGGLDWGHPLVTPEGETIRVPSFALAKLPQLGVLARNCNRLSPLVYELIRPEFDGIGAKVRRRAGIVTTESLRRLLGPDLSGPQWVVCTCKDCKRRAADTDNTALPGPNPLESERISALVRDVTRKRRH
jgi:hypothetical protein